MLLWLVVIGWDHLDHVVSRAGISGNPAYTPALEAWMELSIPERSTAGLQSLTSSSPTGLFVAFFFKLRLDSVMSVRQRSSRSDIS